MTAGLGPRGTVGPSVAAASAPGAFVAVPAARVLDTQSGVGASSGPVAAGATLTFQVAGRGGVPASGVGVVLLTVTAVKPTASGSLAVYPTGRTGQTLPNLQLTARRAVSGLVAVPLGSGGQVTVANQSAGTVSLRADASGYSLGGTPGAPGTYAPVSPARLLDTAAGTGTTAGKVPGGGTVTVEVAGRGGIPSSGVSAALLTLTAVEPSRVGSLTAYPAGAAPPTASSLAFPGRQTTSNLVAVPLGTDGRVTVANGSAGTTHVTADVAGYFLGGTPSAEGSFVANGPTRLLDTRDAGGGAAPVGPGASRSLQVTGRAGVPSAGVTAALVDLTAIDASTAGTLTAHAGGADSPTTVNLSFGARRVATGLAMVPLGPGGSIEVRNQGRGTVHVLVDVEGYVLAGASSSAPAPVTGAQVTARSSGSLTLAWTNPTDAGLAGVMVRRAVGSTPPASPTSGTLVADVGPTTTTVRDASLAAGTTYSYSLFAHDGVPRYASAATLTAATSAPVGPTGAVAPLGTVSWTKNSTYDGWNWATPDVVRTYPAGAGRVGVATFEPSSASLSIAVLDPVTRSPVGTTRTVSLAGWPIWGGFLAAADGTFFVLVGRENPTEDDTLDVAAVRHYDAAWNLLGTAYVKGGATQGIKGIYRPFEAGAPHIALVGQRLVVHMCRLMYASNGVHHQGNMTVEVDVPSMTAQTFQSLGGYPYSSHSFQQLVTSSGSDLVLVDHGDAYPRAVQVGVLSGYPAQRSAKTYRVFPINGATGANATGVSVTGIGSSSSRVVVVGTSVPQPDAPSGALNTSLSRKVFAVSMVPSTGASTIRWLTDFSPTGSTRAEEPRLVTLAADRFALLFTVRDGSASRTEYRLIDSSGTTLAASTLPGLAYDAGNDPVRVGNAVYWAGRDAGGRTAYLYGLDVTDPANPVALG